MARDVRQAQPPSKHAPTLLLQWGAARMLSRLHLRGLVAASSDCAQTCKVGMRLSQQPPSCSFMMPGTNAMSLAREDGHADVAGPQLPSHHLRFCDYVPTGLVSAVPHPSAAVTALISESGQVDILHHDCWQEAWLSLVTLTAPATAGPLLASQWVPAGEGQCLSGHKSQRTYGGARLIVLSMSGGIYEAAWDTCTLHQIGEVGGGAVWALAGFHVTGEDRGSNKPITLPPRASIASAEPQHLGSILALACEDGAVRLVYLSPLPSEDGEDATLIATCPGTDGRALSVAWHPHLPILFAGTATGVIRGWDLSQPCLKVSRLGKAVLGEADEAPEELTSTTTTTRRASASAADFLTFHTDTTTVGSGSYAGGTTVMGWGGSAGPRALVRLQVDSLSRHDAAVWTLSVSSDVCVIAGDARGKVTVWDGRTGTAALSQPISHHEGDVLTVSIFEDSISLARGDASIAQLVAPAEHLYVASAGVDGKVSVVRRVMPAADLSLPPSLAPTGRWVPVGSHRGHSHDVRSAFLLPIPSTASAATHYAGDTAARSGLPRISPRVPLCVVTCGADGMLVAQQVSLLTNSLSQPRRLAAFALGRDRQKVSFAPQAALLAYAGPSASNGVEIWGVGGVSESKTTPHPALAALLSPPPQHPRNKRRRPEDTTTSATSEEGALVVKRVSANKQSPGSHTHWLTIETCAPGAVEALSGSALPASGVGCVSLTQDGTWLAYYTSRATDESTAAASCGLNIVRLGLSRGEGGELEGVRPEYIAVPLTATRELAGTIITHIAFVACPGPKAAHLLIALSPLRFHVFMCGPRYSATSGPASGVKRPLASATGSGSGDSTVQYLYSLPIPARTVEPDHMAQYATAAVAAPIAVPGRAPAVSSVSTPTRSSSKAAAAAVVSEDTSEGESSEGEVVLGSLQPKSNRKLRRLAARGVVLPFTEGTGTGTGSRSASVRDAMFSQPQFISCVTAVNDASLPGVRLAIALTSGFIQVFKLTRTGGSLENTSYRFDSAVTAMSYVETPTGTSSKAAVCSTLAVATRNGAVSMLAAATMESVTPLSPALTRASVAAWRAGARYNMTAAVGSDKGRVHGHGHGGSSGKGKPTSEVAGDAHFWLDAPLQLVSLRQASRSHPVMIAIGTHHAATLHCDSSSEGSTTAKVHPFRYTNVIAAACLEGSAVGGTAAHPHDEFACVEIPWRVITKHLTGSLSRKRYGV